MEKILDIITGKMQAAFVAAGYDASFGRVTVSNRPDLCEYQCSGQSAVALIFTQVRPIGYGDPAKGCIIACFRKGVLHFCGDDI